MKRSLLLLVVLGLFGGCTEAPKGHAEQSPPTGPEAADKAPASGPTTKIDMH